MGVYQKWQEERDKAKEKLEEAEKHLRKSIKKSDSGYSPEPATDEFRNRMRKCSMKILDVIDKL